MILLLTGSSLLYLLQFHYCFILQEQQNAMLLAVLILINSSELGKEYTTQQPLDGNTYH